MFAAVDLGENLAELLEPSLPYFSNDDGVGPTIELIGPDTINLEVGEIFTDPGAVANDLQDGSCSIQVNGGPVNADVVGIYFMTYTAHDLVGNTSLPALVTRTVVVGSPSPYDFWSARNDLVGDNASRTADPDKDGYSNLEEHAFGGDPTKGDSALLTPSIYANEMVVTWLQLTHAPVGSYQIVSTSDLGTQPTSNAVLSDMATLASDQTGVPVGYLRMQLSFPIAAERIFLTLTFRE